MMQSFGVAADEEDGIEAGELTPRQAAVASPRAKLFAEHRDRPLARLVDVRERAPRRVGLGDRANLDPEACQLCARAPTEVVGAEGGEKQRSEERRVGKECPQLCRYRWS